MRLPFELPPTLQAFSTEFMSAFESEVDNPLPNDCHMVSSANDRADAPVALAASPEIQNRSIASAAAETAGLIVSSLRALVPSSTTTVAHHAADAIPRASNTRNQDAVDDPHAPGSCRDVQESVDRELALFGRLPSSPPLATLVTDLLRHNYMRLSFALLFLGLMLLYIW
jgi:hypothetical protein